MINLKRPELTPFVKEYLLDHIGKEYILSYDEFSIYRKDTEYVEYLLSFPNDDKVMVISMYFMPNDKYLYLRSLSIGINIQGEQVFPYTLDRKYQEDIPNLMNKVMKIIYPKQP